MGLILTLFILQELIPIKYIDPFGRMPTHYQEYIATRVFKPFSYKVIKSVESRDNLIVVVINDSLYPEIQNSVDQYIQDLLNEGFSTKVITTLGGTPEDIRNLLISELPNGLIGALLIGDLPIAWWEKGHGSEDFPIDFFFTDLDGNWTDTDGNGLYDQHTGSLAPDIWAGRLYASRFTYDNEARLINNYFARNHQYRTGNLTLPNQGLVYSDIGIPDYGMGYLYDDVTVIYNENTTTAYDYKNRLNQGFQFVQLLCHSSCWAHTFFLAGEEYGGGSVFSFEIPVLDPNAFFYFLNSCMTARYTETDDLANWYLFSHSFSLVVIASSELMWFTSPTDIYRALGNDSTFGDAFKKWHQLIYYDFMGTLILGDPSLRVLEHSLSPENNPMPKYSGNTAADWTTYQVEDSPFVNGRPSLGNGQDRLWIFWDSGRITRSDTYMSFFTGSDFAPPESIAWDEYYDFFPSVITDNAGRIWVAWQSFRDYHIYPYYAHFNIYSCYYDGSWSSPQCVQPRDSWHDVQPALAAGDDDKVWVAFKSLRDGNANIYVSNATSGGPWIDSYALTQTPEDETDPAIVIDQNNNVWVFWSNSGNGHYQIFGRRYTDAWQAPFAVDMSNTDNLSVQAAVDSLNQIWLVWHRWDNEQSDIYYSYYDGHKWLSPQPITSDPEDDILPSITVDKLGRPWVCWMSKRDSNFNIYYSYYDNGWTIPQAVTNDIACDMDPSIISDDSSRIWVTWASNRNDYWNIYAAVANLPGVAEQKPVSYQTSGIRILPNPFHKAILFESQNPFEVEIYTPVGRLIDKFKTDKRKYLWTPKKLTQGVYFAKIKTENSEESIKIIHIK